MRRVDSTELCEVVHECMPRMALSLGLPGSFARALADRKSSAAAMRERLTMVRDEAWRVAKCWAEVGESHEAERGEHFATLAGLLALVLDVRGHDRQLADELLDRALIMVAAWTLVEIAVRRSRLTLAQRFVAAWSNLRARVLAGRRRHAPA